MINGFTNLTTAGTLHTAAAVASIVLGAEQLLRKRRDRLHRLLGYGYVFAMIGTDLWALSVYRFTGGFNPFHGGAIANLFCLTMALRPMLSRPRPANWELTHYMWICWSYVGLLAAALTEVIIRTQVMGGVQQTIVATVLATSAVAATGTFLIRRRRPAERGRGLRTSQTPPGPPG